MAQDPLQIAIEDHRAGRLTRAEAGYRAVLQSQPNHPDALHWLGVIHLHAGQCEEAISLLKRASAARPTDSAFAFNLGQAYLKTHQYDQAVHILSHAWKLDPSHYETLLSLTRAKLGASRLDQSKQAVDLMQTAIAGGLDLAEAYDLLGLALMASGDGDGAAKTCAAAVHRNGSDPLMRYHLGLAQRSTGQIKEARKSLMKALEAEPTFAQGWYALGMLDAEAGRHAESAGLFRRAISAHRDYVAAYQALASALAAQGKTEEAAKVRLQAQAAARGNVATSPPISPSESIAQLEQRITPSADDSKAHFAMAAIMNVFPPAQVPAASVSSLFDRYAHRFDEHLVGRLEYHVPQLLADALASLPLSQQLSVADLGCGTGLCGLFLRSRSARLVGVDLSAAMIEQARLRNVYDDIQQADLVNFLRTCPEEYDLLVAADVLIYVGDLSLAFEAAIAALKPGGCFAFSIEAFDGERYDLDSYSRRFKHSITYINRLASMHGFASQAQLPIVIRKERDQPVQGWLLILQRPKGGE